MLGAWLLFLKLKRWYSATNVVWCIRWWRRGRGTSLELSFLFFKRVSNILIVPKFFNYKYLGEF